MKITQAKFGGIFDTQFQEYAKILDQKNEKRERLVKASRDITQKSKKLIFQLHRLHTKDGERDLNAVTDVARGVRLQLARTVAAELSEEDYYTFHRAFSPGMQEYIEARTFLTFLRDGTLLSWEGLQEEILEVCKEEDVRGLKVDPTDYLLGIADLTGELMRVAVASRQEAPAVCVFLREVEVCIHDISTRHSLSVRDMPRKLSTLKASVGKVERSCFTRIIREAEMGSN